MPVVPLVPAPGGPIEADVVENAVRAWVSSPALHAVLRVAGFPISEIPAGDLLEDLWALERFSTAWDFRNGRERNLAGSPIITAELEDVVLSAAEALGLRGAFECPALPRYDHCLVLGGLVRACITRPRWAAAMRDQGIAYGDLTALGAFRPLSSDEEQLAAEAGLGSVADEFAAMSAGIRAAFGLTDVGELENCLVDRDPNSGWAVRRFSNLDSPLAVVVAPSSCPTRRANTADTYTWWAENLVRLTPSHRVLLVTTSIYVPFQHADAVRMLAAVYGCAIDTVGVPLDYAPGITPMRFKATHYLQEFRSTIHAFRRLVESLPLQR